MARISDRWIGYCVGAGCLALGLFASEKGRSQAPPVQTQVFDVASIKPSAPASTGEDWDSGGGRVSIRGYTLRKLVQEAYGLKSIAEVVGGPEWIDKGRFDIRAKMPDEVIAASKDSNSDLDVFVHNMLQALLRERFSLQVRSSQRELPVLALTAVSKHVRITPDEQKSHSLTSRNGEMTAIATSMQEFAVFLSRMREVGQRSVVDRTGLDGGYDFSMRWTPDRGSGIPADSASPGLFTALHEQLGLELKAAKADATVVEVIAAAVPRFD